MGVRINSSVSAAKASASAQQATPKKDGQPAAGTDTDFSQVLAKAQPKKKADAAPPSDKPAPAVAKAAGKKPAKAKAKDDQTDDAQAVTPGDPAVKRPEVADDGDDTTPIEDVDSDTTPIAVTEDGDDSEGDTASIINSQQPVVVQTDPAQFIAQASPTPTPAPAPPPVSSHEMTPAPSPAPVQRADVSVTPDAQPAKAVKASPVEDMPTAAKAAGVPEKVQKNTEVPAEHDVEELKPTAAHEEVKVAVRSAAQTQDDQPPADSEPDGAEVRAQDKPDALKVAAAASPVAQFNELFQAATDRVSGDGAEKSAEKATSSIDAALTAATNNTPAPKVAEAKPTQPPAPPAPPEVRFAEDNHPKVVTAVKSQLLPGGGSIQLRLDPPDLGPLRLEVRMENGSMSASFVTASDQATSLLTHTLGQLKHALEGAGISVDKLQVRQGSADQFADNADQRQQQGGASDQSSARQEQQRREMLNRMWQKVAGGDPLDLVA